MKKPLDRVLSVYTNSETASAQFSKEEKARHENAGPFC
jgi:hypothetical protein